MNELYMSIVDSYAQRSKARRAKVGAVLVTKSGVLLPGYNGTPTGLDNACENVTETGLVTKQSVIHAELNCILKAAREGISVVDSTLYVSLCPCLQCSAMIVQAGVKHVIFGEYYRDTQGLDLLQEAGVYFEHFNKRD